MFPSSFPIEAPTTGPARRSSSLARNAPSLPSRSWQGLSTQMSVSTDFMSRQVSFSKHSTKFVLHTLTITSRCVSFQDLSSISLLASTREFLQYSVPGTVEYSTYEDEVRQAEFFQGNVQASDKQVAAWARRNAERTGEIMPY